jgi:hypothetical protein
MTPRHGPTLDLGVSEGPSKLDDAVSVPVGVLEPGDAFVAQLGDALVVRLEPISVVVFESDAVGGEFVDRLLDVCDLPGGDRASRLAGTGRRGIDVDLASLAALVGDSAVETPGGSSRKVPSRPRGQRRYDRFDPDLGERVSWSSTARRR